MWDKYTIIPRKYKRKIDFFGRQMYYFGIYKNREVYL